MSPKKSKKSAAPKRALSPVSKSTTSSSSSASAKPKGKGKSAAAYQKMKMTELRELLRERGLSDKGRKKLDLIERLTSDDINSVDFGSSSSSSALTNVRTNCVMSCINQRTSLSLRFRLCVLTFVSVYPWRYAMLMSFWFSRSVCRRW